MDDKKLTELTINDFRVIKSESMIPCEDCYLVACSITPHYIILKKMLEKKHKINCIRDHIAYERIFK